MPADSPNDPMDRAVAAARSQTMIELREVLRLAPVPVLAKVVVDLARPLFRDEYRGEPAGSGEIWADAIARPRVAALPSMLVRIHKGEFAFEHVSNLVEAMRAAGARQAALVVIGPPVAPIAREGLGAMVPWVIDLDGLVHLMMSARVGIGARVYEVPHIDADYFR